MRISQNKYVAVTYDLNVGEGDERELMEQATPEHPLEFIYGIGMMIPAFEKALKGLQVGESFDFTIAPEDACGEYMEEDMVELEKSIFETDGKFNSEIVREGAIITMMLSNGERRNGTVMEIKDDSVVMNFNHLLAGETLHFSGKVVDVHDATAEEIAALTAPVGGCGCGDCGGGCDEPSQNGGCGCSGCK